MPDTDPAYTAELAAQLITRRPDLLDIAETELRDFRRFKATIADFLRNPAIALDIRQNLAADLHLPEPHR